MSDDIPQRLYSIYIQATTYTSYCVNSAYIVTTNTKAKVPSFVTTYLIENKFSILNIF